MMFPILYPKNTSSNEIKQTAFNLGEIFMDAPHPRSAHHTPHAVGNKFNYTDSAWTWAAPTGKKEVTFQRSGPVATEMKSSGKVECNTHTHTHTH